MTNDLHEIGELIFACKTISQLANMEYKLRDEYPELTDDIYDYARWQYVNIREREKAEKEIKENGWN